MVNKLNNHGSVFATRLKSLFNLLQEPTARSNPEQLATSQFSIAANALPALSFTAALPIMARAVPAERFTSALAEAGARWGTAELIASSAGAVQGASAGALAMAGAVALLSISTLGLVIYNELNGGSADIFHWWGDAAFDYLHPEDKEPAKEPQKKDQITGDSIPKDPAADEKEAWLRYQRAMQLVIYHGVPRQEAFMRMGLDGMGRVIANGSAPKPISGTVASAGGEAPVADGSATSGANTNIEEDGNPGTLAKRRIERAEPAQLHLPGTVPELRRLAEVIEAPIFPSAAPVDLPTAKGNTGPASSTNELLRGISPEIIAKKLSTFPLSVIISVGCDYTVRVPKPTLHSYAAQRLMESLLPPERSLADDYKMVRRWGTEDWEFVRARLQEQYPWLKDLNPPRDLPGRTLAEIESIHEKWFQEQLTKHGTDLPVVSLEDVDQVRELQR